jgi:hypothetical protein
MQSLTVKIKIVCFIFLSALGIQAQQPASQGPATAGAVPRLVRFAGSFHAPAGQPAGPIGATFAIYNEPEGGTPLWTEDQNVELDAAGNYSVLLGSTKNEGVPAELFGANDPRWLQVKFNVPDAVDAPRVLLVSVPYALKAVDADTLGGKPASAYLMAAPSASVQPEVAAAAAAATTVPAGAAPVKRSARPENVISGTMGRIPYFYDTTSDLGNSVMYQSSAGNIGIGTTSPGQLLTVQTAATGYTFLENIYGSIDPGNGATRLEVGNPVSSLMLTAYGSQSPGILARSAGLVSLAGPLLVGNAAAGAPLYLYAGNSYTAPQFTLLATGSVGIGTQNPGATLEVNGTLLADGGVQGSGSTAVYGAGTSFGVYGVTSNVGGAGLEGYNSAGGDAIVGESTGTAVAGVSTGTAGFNSVGVYGTAPTGGYAGDFYGDVEITGTLNGETPEIKMDHPVDPANKYLFHSSVGSSEMMNIYTGNVTTDAQGLATVHLPEWFEILNTDFRYQLTPIGQFAQAIVSSEVANHQFSIKTDKPNVKVSWQITGVRQDAYAKANPLVVEREKDARERGYYIHPELYGASEQRGMEWARHPQTMKKIQESKAQQLAAPQNQAAAARALERPLAMPPGLRNMPPPAFPASALKSAPAAKQAVPEK